MSDVIEKQDIKELIREVHTRLDRKEYSEGVEEDLEMDTDIIQELIRKREGQNLKLDELVITCWDEYSGPKEEGTLCLDFDPIQISRIIGLTYSLVKVARAVYFTYIIGNRLKLMPDERIIEIVTATLNSEGGKD